MLNRAACAYLTRSNIFSVPAIASSRPIVPWTYGAQFVSTGFRYWGQARLKRSVENGVYAMPLAFNTSWTAALVKCRDAVWPFDKPQYLILNLAIGGSWGGQQGVDDSAFPTRFLIDYVRVYRR
jgi:hypothetical protein